MDKFNWFFDKDRYTVYKTWHHDSSVVYRLTTWTNLIAYASSFVTPTKVNIIFLKVQESGFSNAYEALRKSGLTLDANAKHGLDDNAITMGAQKIKMWNTTSGADIKEFCRKNQKQVSVAMEETGHMRIFYIVWEPEVAKEPRVEGFKEFCTEHFKAQLTFKEWNEGLKKPVKWLAGALVFGN
jgi:hypothetical protein